MPFDAETIDGYADGEWPPPLASLMSGWIPRDVLQRFGVTAFNALHQTWTDIASEHFEEIISSLREQGFLVEINYGLIERASGYDG